MMKSNHMAAKIWQDFSGLVRVWPFIKSEKKLVIGGAMLIPVISLLATALPIVLKWTIDEGITTGNTRNLFIGSLIYLAIVVIDYGARAGQTMVTALSVHRMILNMRRYLVDHVLRLSARFHDRSMSGALVTRATGDFDNLSESLNQGVLTSIVDIFVLVGTVVGIFILNWRLALCTLAILPVVAFLVGWFSRALKKAMLKARAKIAALNAFTQECLYGHSTVKLLTAEDATQRRFERMAVEYRDAQMESVVLDSLMFSILDGIASITIGVVLWFSISQVHTFDNLTPGLMVAFVAYIQNLFEPLKQLGNKMAMLQGAFTSLDRIFGVIENKDFVQGDEIVMNLKGEVVFDKVTFQYGKEPGDPKVLKNVSFHMGQGQSVALVGATGSGKSTVAKLIAKLYDGYEGSIKIDGEELSTLDGKALRSHMAIVPQDIALFSGTIAFNISLGVSGITLADVERAAKLVGADAFIRALPGGYNFLVNEQGSNLSYGQCQLIAFARALARNPSFVVLDEATSSVDPMAEAAIQDAIKIMLRGRSVLVIAHRLSTIRQCDQILVMKRGEIIESGRHEELMANEGAYYRLALAMAEEKGERGAAYAPPSN